MSTQRPDDGGVTTLKIAVRTFIAGVQACILFVKIKDDLVIQLVSKFPAFYRTRRCKTCSQESATAHFPYTCCSDHLFTYHSHFFIYDHLIFSNYSAFRL